MYILSAKCPVLSVKMISSFYMGMQFHSLGNRVHIPVSSGKCPQPCALCHWTLDTRHWTESSVSATFPATKAKSIVGQWPAMPRNSTERRFLKESTGHHPTTPCIENCIIWHLGTESVVHHWTRGGRAVALRGGIQYLSALTTPQSVKSLHQHRQ